MMTLNLGRDSGVHYRANWSRFSEGWGGWVGGLVQLAGRIETLTDHALAESIELNIELKSKTEKLLCEVTFTAKLPQRQTVPLKGRSAENVCKKFPT